MSREKARDVAEFITRQLDAFEKAITGKSEAGGAD
jgi:hypothetical protein